MEKWKQFINDVYMGIYFYSSRYESSDEALKNSKFRIGIIFFPYYFGIVLLLLNIYIRNFGTFKMSASQAIIILILYVVLCILFIINIIDKNIDVTKIEKIKRVKERVFKYTTIGGAGFALSILLFIS